MPPTTSAGHKASVPGLVAESRHSLVGLLCMFAMASNATNEATSAHRPLDVLIGWL